MSKKIMVVDDSRIAQLQLQEILSGTDYEVVCLLPERGGSTGAV